MQCIVRTTLSHTMSVCPSVTHNVRLSVRHRRCPSVRPSHTMSVCPSVTHDVRPSHTMSVCPSVTRRYCVKTAKRITVLSPSGRHTILIVPHSTLSQYSDGDPLTGSSNTGDMKNRDFRPVSCFISKMIKDRDIATMVRNFTNRKLYARVSVI